MRSTTRSARNPRLITPAVVAFLCFCRLASAEVKLNTLFGDHAVLQQGINLPVWGTADEGEAVTVEIAGQKVSTKAAGGKWSVTLAPLKAGGPFDMTVTGTNRLTIHDLLVGEVWICSGQSNMERQLGPRPPQLEIDNWKAEVAAANYPTIRLFTVPENGSPTPLDDVKGTWKICAPENAKAFSAVGYFFGRDLGQAIHVPIGLIHSSVGGTSAALWTSRQALEANPTLAPIAAKWEKALANYSTVMAEWKAHEPERKAAYAAAVAKAKAEGKPTPGMPRPPGNPMTRGATTLFNAMIHPLIPYGIRGVIWYQGESDVGDPKTYRTLFPTMIADWRTRWNSPANSPEPATGESVSPSANRSSAPVSAETAVASAAGAGSSSAAVASAGGAGSSTTAAPASSATVASSAAPAALEAAAGAPAVGGPTAGGPAMGAAGQASEGDFPFLFVQIAPYRGNGPALRQAQLLTFLHTPNTAMVVTTDCGDATNIHPTHKQPVGARLALAARALAYGESIEYSGPLYLKLTVDNDTATVSFTHVGKGLVAHGGDLRGFEIAGPDGKFFPAKASIAGDTVQLSSEKVSHPVAARFGWAGVPDVNLFNADGLPASPFTTEDSMN